MVKGCESGVDEGDVTLGSNSSINFFLKRALLKQRESGKLFNFYNVIVPMAAERTLKLLEVILSTESQ